VYKIDGFVMVHTGRPLPTGDDAVLRNKGVGIVLWLQLGEVLVNVGRP